MKTNSKFARLADEKTIKKTADALKKLGVDVLIAENREEARKKIFDILPAGAEVMNMTSETLDQTGITSEIIGSGRYSPIRITFEKLSAKNKAQEMKKMGCAPKWTIGSVHAITTQGQFMIASATGSQLGAYAYGADKVLWVASTKKIVLDLDEGFQRIHQYTFPLEDARAKKAYGVGSGVNKILIFNKEVVLGRITLILVKENLGY